MSDAVKPQMHGRDHRFGGSDPIPGLEHAWARRKRYSTTQTIAGNSSQVVIAYETTADVNNYTDYFALVQAGAVDSAIKVLKDGLYSILCRVFCGSLATEFTINLWGIDPDSWGPYGESTSTLQTSTELAGKASVVVRLATNQTIFATIRQNSGTNKTIDVGTFLEVAYLGPATTTGRLADS